MDLKGSLVDTKLRIYPAQHFTSFLKTLPDHDDIPVNILKLINRDHKGTLNKDTILLKPVQLNDEDLENLDKINKFVEGKTRLPETDANEPEPETDDNNKLDDERDIPNEKEKSGDTPEKQAGKNSVEKESIGTKDSKEDESTNTKVSKGKESLEKDPKPFLTTLDIDWLYSYLQIRKSKGDNVPYLHSLLEGANVEMPENIVIKRNPLLEARCVKLRAQQEAREYRKMTKTVDNVRMRFPEDSISYQMKQLNRQLIAIGQFIISIFAGFLFGFRGVEWMVGNLEFGFRLLLGVMCALVIALAEIYFLAKKLNEELNIPETVQLGGPPKFADEHRYRHLPSKVVEKEHQD